MRTKLRGRISLLFMTCALLIAVPAVAAIADQINVDGDILAPNNQGTINLGDVDPGQTLSPQVSFQLNCNSNDHVNRNATVSLAYSAAGSTIPSGGTLSATDAQISVPNTWPTDTNSCGSVVNLNDNGNSQVSITAPKSPGAKSFVVTYNVLAPVDANGSTGIQGGSTRSVTYNMNVRNLPPTISSVDGVPTVTEGQHHLYIINASDPNETSLNYGLSKASGTANVAITPMGNGHFDVHFQTAGNVVLQASVNDGVNTPVTALKPVTVNPANTAPQVSVTGFNNDDSVEIGSEPTPGCSVVDAEDTNEAATPVVNRSGLNSFGLGTVSVSCTYTDGGGITRSDTKTYTIVDTGAPSSSHQLSAAANANGWHKANVTVTLNGNDSGSGLKEIRYSINGGAYSVYSASSKPVISTEGTTTFSYYAVDNANNSETPANSFEIKLDKTAPTIDGSASPAPNGAGWNNTNVTVSFDCADALSGVASCSADVTLSSDGVDQSVTRSATDNAGNSASDTVSNIDIDKTDPSVSVTGVSNGATYTVGNVPTAGCDTQDQQGLSGVKTNATLSVTGGNNGFGTFTATCSGAEDNADNAQAAPVSVTYGVKAAFNGFLQPIDGHSVNTGKYGRTYPIKWQLRDSSGALISDTTAQLLVGTMTGGQKAVSCTSFDLGDADALEESTTGNTALRYDATSDQFIYNYKAPSSGSCYVFAIRNADGLTTQQIDFKFTK